jgi:hypothetical protein
MKADEAGYTRNKEFHLLFESAFKQVDRATLRV